VSMFDTQEESVSAPVRGLGQPFVLVTGGKGGVGKSTVAANLATLFGRAKARPLLVDLDFELANLDILLGVEPGPRMGAYLSGKMSLTKCLVATPYGVNLLPAGSAASEEYKPVDSAARSRLLKGLRAVAPNHGLVIGDSAAGIGPEVLTFASEADRVLVVTTPDPAALTDAYGVLKALDHWSRERELDVATPELFVNFAASADEAQRSVRGLVSASRRFLGRTPRVGGWMPRGRAVSQAILGRRPFVVDAPKAPATRQLARLAHRWADALLSSSNLEKGS
jgi:flagellar biosynthesis protein FlhG